MMGWVLGSVQKCAECYICTPYVPYDICNYVYVSFLTEFFYTSKFNKNLVSKKEGHKILIAKK